MARRKQLKGVDGTVFVSPFAHIPSPHLELQMQDCLKQAYDMFASGVNELVKIRKEFKQRIYPNDGSNFIRNGNLLMVMANICTDPRLGKSEQIYTKLRWKTVVFAKRISGVTRLVSEWIPDTHITKKYLWNSEMKKNIDFILEIDYERRCANSIIEKAKNDINAVRSYLESYMMFQGMAFADCYSFTGEKKFQNVYEKNENLDDSNEDEDEYDFKPKTKSKFVEAVVDNVSLTNASKIIIDKDGNKILKKKKQDECFVDDYDRLTEMEADLEDE